MDKIYHRVVLAGDTATALDEPGGIWGSPGTLNFGRAGNNGIHVLRMELAQDWQGLVVKAAFRTPSGCYHALIDKNNEIAVPASVTAQATSALLGLISFDGTDAEGRARAGNLLYYVEDVGCPACPTPPDPDIWQMLVQMLIAAMPKQATADTLGTVKAQPVEEQGGRAPVVILPNGMLLAPAGAGSGSYNDLEDKPQINGNELIGNKTWQQLGFPDVEAFATAAAQSAQEAQTAASVAGSAAGAASGSATAAQGSASTASTKAGEADASAQAAAQSASSAEQSKTAAAGSASDADQSAQQAADSASDADGSASAAASSASAAASDAARAETAANKIPTPAGSADAGKFVAVNSAGDGYELRTGGGGGTTDYNTLENKPSLNGVTMEGDKTAEDYGLATKEELPKQATDTEAGIAKFKPIAEQGNNVPASILPNGTVVVPPGGGSGGGINPTLLATLNGDGESIELTADVDLTDGLYAFGGGIPENTPDENKGQTLYAKIGDTGIFGQGIRLAPMPSNATIGNQNEVATIYIKNNAMYLCGAFSAGGNKNQAMVFKPDGVPVVKQKISLYSQSSKPVPVGAYAMLWRLG